MARRDGARVLSSAQYDRLVFEADLRALIRLMPPPTGAGDEVDWAAVEVELGTPLPADYRAFISVYGGGCIGRDLNVLLPRPAPGPQWEEPGLAAETANLRLNWRHEIDRAGLDLNENDLLSWGVGSMEPDLLGWVTSDPDPERWPVLARPRHVNYGEPTWQLYDCGMIAFLVRLLRAQLVRCPLSGTALWGRPATFVDWREQQRRFQAGLDPITGESDPYAGMPPPVPGP
jgi:hypothetical protein